MRDSQKRTSLIAIVFAAILIGIAVNYLEPNQYVIDTTNIEAENQHIPYLEETENAVDENGIVNINTAAAEQLEELDGIGEKLAQRIIKYRTENGNFEVVEEIMNVSGIGEKLFEKIRDNITVEFGK